MGGRGEFGPLFFVFSFFFFFFTLLLHSFFFLHCHYSQASSFFLHFHTISCLENHFSRLPNSISSIPQNIFFKSLSSLSSLQNPFFFLKPIFKPPSLHFHGIFSWTNFSYFQWEEISSIPRMEWWRGPPSRPKIPAPHSSKKDFKVSSFFAFFFVGKFVDFTFCWEHYDGTLSFCCLFLWESWTLYDLVGNYYVVILFSLFWGIFELLSCLVLLGHMWFPC